MVGTIANIVIPITRPTNDSVGVLKINPKAQKRHIINPPITPVNPPRRCVFVHTVWLESVHGVRIPSQWFCFITPK